MTKKLGFGLMRLPLTNANDQKSVDLEQVKNMVDTFLAKGFTYFDTAFMYHDFQSECVVREALVKRHTRNSFTLTTKLPLALMNSAAEQEKIFAEQLQKCGVEYFDYYLLHAMTKANYEKAKKWDSFGFLAQKKKEGKIRHIGFSFHDNAQLLDEILTAHPEVEYVQIQLNYLDWDNASIQSRKCYETIRKHGKQVLVMEPVKGGTLNKVPQKVVDLFKTKEPTMSIPSWAIRFAASHEGIFMVLSGMSSLEQLEDNTGYMENFRPFTQEEYATVAKAVDIINEAVLVPCTACHYCTKGCPKKIAIPEYFALLNNDHQAKMKGFSTQKFYYEMGYTDNGKASACIACGQCERICPQHIPVIKWLKEVARTFEGTK